MSTRRIAAIGGGGFLMGDDSGRQECWLLSLTRRAARPRVLWVGTASGDAERAQLMFFRTFGALDCVPAVLTFFPYDMRLDQRRAVLDADLVYVGGGNTVAMVAVWREFGFDAGLRAAYEHGTVLAGISAGANCWFERYVTDSVPGGGVREGLGWLPGTFSPHLDGEPWRQPVLASEPAPAAGAGDGVVLLYEDERRAAAVHTADGEPLLWCRDPGDATHRVHSPQAL